MKRGLLHPLECTKDEIALGCFLKAYYAYHKRKGNTTNFCKALKATIIDLMEQGRYNIDENLAKQGGLINVITLNKKVCTNL